MEYEFHLPKTFSILKIYHVYCQPISGGTDFVVEVFVMDPVSGETPFMLCDVESSAGAQISNADSPSKTMFPNSAITDAVSYIYEYL